jgi:hypothetical protein
MTSFYDAHIPPPPQPMTVLGRHGAKFKVRIFGQTRIMDTETILKFAASRRQAGADVSLNGFIEE